MIYFGIYKISDIVEKSRLYFTGDAHLDKKQAVFLPIFSIQ